MKQAGVDEAGRGPLAGPVVAAAVILSRPIDGLRDSKMLSEKKREQLAKQIQEAAETFAYGFASPEEIDALNIHQSTLLAMERALLGLTLPVDEVLVDGLFVPAKYQDIGKAFVKGDARYPVISAASILAKTKRDALMLQLDVQFPNYGFAKHKGYPTKAHLIALSSHGPCDAHRKSFKPVREMS